MAAHSGYETQRGRQDVMPEVLKQGYQWPQKWTCVLPKHFKKRKKKINMWFK